MGTVADAGKGGTTDRREAEKSRAVGMRVLCACVCACGKARQALCFPPLHVFALLVAPTPSLTRAHSLLDGCVQLPANAACILDGFPLEVHQARMLEKECKYAERVFLLQCSDEVAEERLYKQDRTVTFGLRSLLGSRLAHSTHELHTPAHASDLDTRSDSELDAVLVHNERQGRARTRAWGSVGVASDMESGHSLPLHPQGNGSSSSGEQEPFSSNERFADTGGGGGGGGGGGVDDDSDEADDVRGDAGLAGVRSTAGGRGRSSGARNDQQDTRDSGGGGGGSQRPSLLRRSTSDNGAEVLARLHEALDGGGGGGRGAVRGTGQTNSSSSSSSGGGSSNSNSNSDAMELVELRTQSTSHQGQHGGSEEGGKQGQEEQGRDEAVTGFPAGALQGDEAGSDVEFGLGTHGQSSRAGAQFTTSEDAGKDAKQAMRETVQGKSFFRATLHPSHTAQSASASHTRRDEQRRHGDAKRSSVGDPTQPQSSTQQQQQQQQQQQRHVEVMYTRSMTSSHCDDRRCASDGTAPRGARAETLPSNSSDFYQHMLHEIKSSSPAMGKRGWRHWSPARKAAVAETAATETAAAMPATVRNGTTNQPREVLHEVRVCAFVRSCVCVCVCARARVCVRACVRVCERGG